MPDLSSAESVLKQYFGYDSFRPLQGEIIQSVLDKKDNLVLMPTGGGKSICFQVPALVLPGICVVVSPLIALMKDQVESLRSNGIEAAYINSSQSNDVQLSVEQQALQGELKLLYVSPEKLLSQHFFTIMKNVPLNLIAIDEAHCISAWGHDFRPEYTKLNFLKSSFPEVPIIALTATADKTTRKDIVQQLQLKAPEIFVASFDRPNLSLNVYPGKDRFKIILRLIQSKPNSSGIIYCLSRKSTEELSRKLKAEGISAAHYHAAMSPDQRAKVQEAFIRDDIPVICATIAFGMGIDKSNVRWVIHYNMPKNMEGYYQEIGRAGRDGLPSNTLLFYSFRDVMVLQGFVEDSEQKEVQLAKLQRMQHYAEAPTCRRRILLSYFGEQQDEDCGNCDVCKNPPTVFDGTVLTQKALSGILRAKEQVGSTMLIDILRGSGKRELLDKGYHNLKTYGAGRDVSWVDWQQYLLQMLNQGFFEPDYEEGGLLKVTDSGRQVLFEGKKVDLVKVEEIAKRAEEIQQKAKSKPKKQIVREELFESLRTLRLDLAKKADVPPYVIFNDNTLNEMCLHKPTTEEEMKDISGVGARKYQLYGHLFIDAIVRFLKKKNEEGEKVSGSTYKLTYEYYKEGLSAEEIAEKRNLSPTTIYSHFANLYENGQDIDLHRYVPQDTLNSIEKALEITGESKQLKPIYDYLKEEVPYHQIRMALSILKKSQ